MNAKVNPIPEGMHSLTPHLVCANAVEAMDFYQRAFGGTIGGKMMTPDGKLMHGHMTIGDSALMLMDENKDWGAIGPSDLKASPVTIHLYVTDVDTVFNKAVAEGATVVMPVADMFWGDRYGVLRDPYGHSWSVATHIRDASPEEMEAAAKQGCPGDAA
jgi:PhnB protein